MNRFVFRLLLSLVCVSFLSVNLSASVTIPYTARLINILGEPEALQEFVSTFGLTTQVGRTGTEIPFSGSYTYDHPQTNLTPQTGAGFYFLKEFKINGVSLPFFAAYTAQIYIYPDQYAVVVRTPDERPSFTIGLGVYLPPGTLNPEVLPANADFFTKGLFSTIHPISGLNYTSKGLKPLLGQIVWESAGGETPEEPYDKLHGAPCSHPGSAFCGDPINIATGNLFEEVTDYETAGTADKLSLTRYYNSQANESISTPLGVKWRWGYDRTIRIASPSSVTAERSDGQSLKFTNSGNNWTPDSDVDLSLKRTGSSWTLIDGGDTVETYTDVSASQAVLTKVQARNGYVQMLQYDANNRLASVTDSFGRALNFTYQAGLLRTLTTPDGLVVTYSYDSSKGGGGIADRLTGVAYSTTPQTSQSYVYENPALPFALTGIVDENGKRYVSWIYDASGRATSSQQAGGADLTRVAYNDANGTRTVTYPLEQQEVYTFTLLQGVPKVSRIDRIGTGMAETPSRTFKYDANGYLQEETDWKGYRTVYVNDSRGLPTSITEAAGTSQARTTAITYDPGLHLPTRIAAPSLTTDLAYDPSGNLLTRTLTDTTTTSAPYVTNGTKRIWTYTWENGLLTSVKGPRTDLVQITRFTYDGSGALIRTTNPLGHITQITQHTAGGRPQTIVDANGVTTQLTYDARLRLLSRTVGTAALTTTYAYDLAGNLLKTTLPDGSAFTNSYDDAHRLTQVTDLFGQKMDHALDALGNPTETRVLDAGNVVQRRRSAGFDALGQVLRDIGGAGQITDYGYDAAGHRITVTDPKGSVTRQEFDALNRPVKTIDAAGGVTTLVYDAQDRPVSVTDPNGAITAYVYNGFGDVIQQVSPDTGTTIYRYDADGNLAQRVDARGVVANSTYDALGRVTATTYPGIASATSVPAGGAVTTSTQGLSATIRTGSAAATVTGPIPYGTAVFSVTQNGVVVSEAAVPAAPPTRRARVFIDYRSNVSAGIGTINIDTGIAIAHVGTSAAVVTYTLRERNGNVIATGQGNLGTGAHLAKFLRELQEVAPGFNVPANFATSVLFGSLDIESTQPLSIVALRLTVNQRGETLLTTTPAADLTALSVTTPVYFPQLADGGGYTTSLILLNTSSAPASGSFTIFNDAGTPLSVREAGGSGGSTFPYTMSASGAFVFQTDGSPAATQAGWVRLTPDPGTGAPTGAGVFSFSPGGILVTESGVPSAIPTTRARIYVDKSASHDTGLALANPGGAAVSIVLRAFAMDGSTTAGTGPATLNLAPNGHTAKFAGDMISGLPEGFTGVIEISSASPFAALALRSLTNSRNEFLLTTLPVADANRAVPAPIIFPQIADGGGYTTQFIFVSASGSASTLTLDLSDDNGVPLALGNVITYRYDEAGRGSGIGRLTSVTDDAGALSRYYDERGNISNESRVFGTATLHTAYTYDPADRLASIAYPSGLLVSYSRDRMGQITAVTAKAPGASNAQPVVANILYAPFGPPKALRFGNGIEETRQFDMDYRLTNLTGMGQSLLQNLAYGYDSADNVLSIQDGVRSGNSQAFSYDALHRLTSATGAYGSVEYTYDPVGNRLSETRGGGFSAYSYAPRSNRLLSVDGTGAQSFAYTSGGNISSISPSGGMATALVYDQANRLTAVKTASEQVGQYRYDAFGQRLAKSSLSSMSLYQYSAAGLLLEEGDGTGTARVNYIYLEDRPVATFQPSNGQVYFLHTDRLGTPQAATDSAQSIAWRADYEPFGATSTALSTIIQNLRFPGQEFEAETDSHHNGFRDYVPALGRYLQSDPIGLKGGFNTYLYASGRPLNIIDPRGLETAKPSFLQQFVFTYHQNAVAIDMSTAESNGRLPADCEEQLKKAQEIHDKQLEAATAAANAGGEIADAPKSASKEGIIDASGWLIERVYGMVFQE